MTNHDQIRAQVALAATGALNQDESLAVQRHLRECETCRKEFDTWASYAGGLRQLPHPAIPTDLLARTQARILAERPPASNPGWETAMLVGIAALSWVITLFTWWGLRMLTGGSLSILGVNLLNAGPWVRWSVVVAAAPGGGAALMLGSDREARRIL